MNKYSASVILRVLASSVNIRIGYPISLARMGNMDAESIYRFELCSQCTNFWSLTFCAINKKRVRTPAGLFVASCGNNAFSG